MNEIIFRNCFVEFGIQSILFGMGLDPKSIAGTMTMVAVRILLVPVVAHGIYDTLAMSGMINEYIGGVSFIVLIYFCVKLHKAAKKKILTLMELDKTDYEIII